MGRELWAPRSVGMMQNAQALSQPSEILRYAVHYGLELTFGVRASCT